MAGRVYLVMVVVLCTVNTIRGDVLKEDTVMVSIPQGDLIGRQNQVSSDLYVNFFGRIPFAAPPLGELRFSAPAPPKGWEGQRDATYYGPACTQFGRVFYNHSLENIELPIGLLPDLPGWFPVPDPIEDIVEKIQNLTSRIPLDEIIGTIRNISNTNVTLSDIVGEDCLYMNIYAPQDETFPVMVYIQGGAFAVGTSMYLYDGRILAERNNVIVVNFNYRLGALGFLSTMDEVSPGNYGMLDQVAALEWVKHNIVYFGGDPSSVTLFGQSAGGVSASLQMLSPLSEGLFNKVIVESGNALASWSVILPPYDVTEGTYGLADNIGCPRRPHEDLLACLRTKDPFEISAESPSVCRLIK
ncbi:neuroligin-4, X-linked-like [Saccoglossus kowalevskii]